jgi:hypothetical protein
MAGVRGGSLVSRRRVIYRSMLVAERGTLFVFGDNIQGKGYGGQAGAMRGEPNAVGIPTKWFPGMDAADYFTDADFPKVGPAIDAAFAQLEAHLDRGGKVVVPKAGVGTGLAQLEARAPFIAGYIAGRLDRLEAKYRVVETAGEGDATD